jgi:hypothetical protein
MQSMATSLGLARQLLAQRVGKVEHRQAFSAGSNSMLSTITGALAGGLFGYLGRHFG